MGSAHYQCASQFYRNETELTLSIIVKLFKEFSTGYCNFDKVCLLFRQRRSHLFLVGAAEIKPRRCESERRRPETILGVPGACLPHGIFLNKRCDFVHSGTILSSNFVSF